MLQKLFLLVVVIAVVWYGFKLFGRLDQRRKGELDRDGDGPRVEAADTVQCPVCGAYVAEKGASDCGRADCPY